MPRNIDISLLRAFVAVAETGGMTKSAKLLNLTQAAISQQVKRLEESFGCLLFERDRAGMRLTPSGERLLAQARRLLHNNDEVWAMMTAPEFAGEVRLGMPSDIVRAYGTPVLKRFDQAWPRVRVSIICDTSGRLLEKLDRGEVDLTFTVQKTCFPHGEALLSDPLVWAGARGGHAHERNPLPISTGDDTCPHRPEALRALAAVGRDWRSVCEVSSFEPICATVEADIAVAPMLASTVPSNLQILGERSGLPDLPPFTINLYLPRAGAGDIALELASHIRDQLGSGIQRAA
ncbi:LysR family transcriptional regulator [Mesorhizobium sp. LHD-90]|uniref:LysR family transcriptional regulator n=1 Tax=Mesorhizobium sp. LHD-90 TaxID=3071414 RepID=UPI0027E0FAA3|nr:LysR family transcriptional regulator [Mesorhizobium sp. LHD-90]MDQ6436520.1 LysR family transcriptional regulator [Mesorhizobium sp. LHD-90]